MDKEIFATEDSQLTLTSLRELWGDASIIDYGALVLCRRGRADIRIEFRQWNLSPSKAFILFPGDVIIIENATEDFEVEMLRYDRAMLREASLHLEQSVYHDLKRGRCSGDEGLVSEIFEPMFQLLRIYFRDGDCRYKDQIVLFQMKAFLLHFHDRTSRLKKVEDTGSQRVNELFNQFMQLVERDYKTYHEVSHYAAELNITPKYLVNITKAIAGHSPKTIIDHYIILQLKKALHSSDISIKQLTWDYHFSEPSFFCRYFKRLTGMSPQEFRTSGKR